MSYAIVAIVAVIIYAFYTSLNQDKKDLEDIPFEKRFQTLIGILNNYAYEGQGKVTMVNQRNYSLYQEGTNQIIYFLYGTGHLTISWRFKYFQQEVVHEKQFNDVRNSSPEAQTRIAENMIEEMKVVVERHINNFK